MRATRACDAPVRVPAPRCVCGWPDVLRSAATEYFLVANVPIYDWQATSVEAIEAIVHRYHFSCDPNVLRREAERVARLAAIIKENDGCMPREETLNARGIYL